MILTRGLGVAGGLPVAGWGAGLTAVPTGGGVAAPSSGGGGGGMKLRGRWGSRASIRPEYEVVTRKDIVPRRKRVESQDIADLGDIVWIVEELS